MSMFGFVCKKIPRFSRLAVKNASLSLSCFACRTQNHDPRPLSDLFLRQESNDGLRIGFTWNFNNLIFVALFRKPSISLYLCWWVGFNFKIKSLFWLMSEKLTFWTILPLGSKMSNYSSGELVNARRSWLSPYKRKGLKYSTFYEFR